MKRFIFFTFIFIVLSSVFSFAVLRRKDDAAQSNKIVVAASMYPLQEFVDVVGGDAVTKLDIYPAGADSHEFEPSAQDVAAIYQADIFFYHGAQLDAWAEDLAPELEKDKVKTVEMTSYFILHSVEETEHEEEEQEEEHGEFDPHIWLDPVLVQQEIGIIRDTLSELDPENSFLYATNAEHYIQQLQDLHGAFVAGLFQCETKKIIVAHDAFGYFAARYGIEAYGIAGISPDAEPSSKKLAELTDLAKANNLHYIFFETLTSPKLAETLANEVGAQTLVFNPLEGLRQDEAAQGATYISLMYGNLDQLRLGMGCE